MKLRKLIFDLLRKDSRTLLPLSMLVISDLHSCYWKDMDAITNALQTYSYDIVLSLGDVQRADIQHIAQNAKNKPIYYILGNHDEWHQNEGIENAEDLDGKVIDVNGVKIGGVSGAPRYKQGDWAMRSETEIADTLAKMNDLDILVSHESPYHLLNTSRAHSGYRAITDYVHRIHPALHIFGHHHWPYCEQTEQTKEVCVYKCALIQTVPFSISQII